MLINEGNEADLKKSSPVNLTSEKFLPEKASLDEKYFSDKSASENMTNQLFKDKSISEKPTPKRRIPFNKIKNNSSKDEISKN